MQTKYKKERAKKKVLSEKWMHQWKEKQRRKKKQNPKEKTTQLSEIGKKNVRESEQCGINYFLTDWFLLELSPFLSPNGLCIFGR